MLSVHVDSLAVNISVWSWVCQSLQLDQLSKNINESCFRNILDCNQSMYTPRTLSADTENANSRLICRPKNPDIKPNIKWTWWHVAKIHLKFFNMTTGSNAIGSADLANPGLEPNTEWIGQPVAETGCPFEILPPVGRPPSCDCWTHHVGFPIDGPLWPCVYLARLLRYGALKILESRPWPFGVTWRHQSRDRWARHVGLSIGGLLWPCIYLARLWKYGALNILGSQRWPFWSREVIDHMVIRSAILEYSTQEPNRKWIGWCRDMTIWNSSRLVRRLVVDGHYTDVIYFTAQRIMWLNHQPCLTVVIIKFYFVVIESLIQLQMLRLVQVA